MKIYKKLNITLAIPTLNRPISLKNTLESYFSYEYIPSEIIIVDQSTDKHNAEQVKGTIESYKDFTKMIYLHLDVPSLEHARNIAIEYASNDLLIYSDDDINIFSDTLKNTYDLLSLENVGMVGGFDVFKSHKRSKLSYFVGTNSFSKRKFGHMTKSCLGVYPTTITEKCKTEWCMGYYCCFKISLIKKYGLHWDEKLTGYAYNEDLDFSYRYYCNLKKDNKVSFISKKILVKHLVTNESRIPSDNLLIRFLSNRYYMIHKEEFSYCSLFSFYYSILMLYFKFKITKNNVAGLKNAYKVLKRNKSKIIKGDFYGIY